MIKEFENFESVERISDYIIGSDYIVGIPSGEVFDVDDNQFVRLKNKNLIKHHPRLRCFTFDDKDINLVEKTLLGPRELDKIRDILKVFEINKYAIDDEDLGVHVFQDVDISGLGLKNIPVKFKTIKGSFICKNNKLNNLTNSPEQISGLFDCSINSIYTLIGGPKYVAGGYYCDNNKISTLIGFPGHCQVRFDASHNEIISLKGCPKKLDIRYFDVSYNKLKNLKDGPERAINFDCSHNEITTLVGGPEDVSGIFDCTHNRLFDLMGMPSCSKIKFRDGNKITDIDYD